MARVDSNDVIQHDVRLTWNELATITIILEQYCAQHPHSVHDTPLLILDKFIEEAEDPLLCEIINDAREHVEKLNREAHQRFISGSGAT